MLKPPADLTVGDIRQQIAAERLEKAQWSQWAAYRKSLSLFRMVPLLTPTTSSSPKWGCYAHERRRLSVVTIDATNSKLSVYEQTLTECNGTATITRTQTYSE